jgi:hypothetical protein
MSVSGPSLVGVSDVGGIWLKNSTSRIHREAGCCGIFHLSRFLFWGDMPIGYFEILFE